MRFPAQVLPATVVTTNLINFVLSLPLMFALGALHGIWPTWHLVALPVVIAVQLCLILALCYLVAALNVTFRDLQHIVGNLITLAFFLTPVLYLSTSIPERYRRPDDPGQSHGGARHQLPGDPGGAPAPGCGAAPLGRAVLSLVLLWGASALFESRREEFAESI